MGLFNRYIKEGKGIKKEDVLKGFGFKKFFQLIGDKFWRLCTLNLLYFAVNLPVFGLLAYLSTVGGIRYFAPANVLYQPLHGVMLHGSNPALEALRGVVGVQIESYYPGTVTKILLYIGCLTILTFGIGNAAMTYIQRNFVKDEHTDLGSDFFGCIRRNWKQSILLGIFDLLFAFVAAFDVISYANSNGSFVMLLLFYLTIFLTILYLFMRPYMYIMAVTFDIRFFKIIKNSYILAIAGMKRNLLCGLAAALILFLNFEIYMFVPALGTILLFLMSLSLAWFMQIYGAYPVVKKHMIDPFYTEKSEAELKEGGAVFTDRG